MNLDQFIEFLIEEGEINGEVIKKSLEVNDFPLTHKILLKIEGQTTLLENILRPKNEGELVLAKGDLLRICILNDQNVKQQGIKFIDELIKIVREKFNLYPSEKKVIKNKNSNKPTSKGNETIQESEEDLSSLIQKGDEFYDLEDYSKAIDFYTEAINLNDDNYTLFFNRGLSYQSLDQFENAIKDFGYAIDKCDGNNSICASIFYSRGRCFLYLDKNREAIEDYDSAIDLNPDDDRYFYFRGFSKQELKKYEEAIEDYNSAINLNPNDDRYFYFRGVSKQELKKYEEAIDDFNFAINILSSEGDYYFYRAKSKLDSKKIYKSEEVMKDLSQAVSLLDDSPFKGKVLFTRALELQRKGDYEMCLKDLSDAISLDCNLDYLSERIFIYKGMREYSKAIEDIIECCVKDPQNHLKYKAYLIDFMQPNPYTGKNVFEEEELRLSIIKKYKSKGFDFERSRTVFKVLDSEFSSYSGDPDPLMNQINYYEDKEYQSRIKNLFGEDDDGHEDFVNAFLKFSFLSESTIVASKRTYINDLTINIDNSIENNFYTE